MTDQVTQWAEKVVARKVSVGRLVYLACERHLKDLEEQEQRGLYWDDARASWAIRFFMILKHSKAAWAGQAFILSPWQAFIVGSLLGWKIGDAGGPRRYRVAYNEIPRKNGKSTLAAGLGLLLAFFDDEAGAEVYCAATKRDQARIVFGEAKRMVRATPHLRKQIQSLVGNLSVAATGSKLEPLGADADSTDGLNPNGVIIDELHAHKSAALVDVLQSASGARRQPLRFEITTAGYDRTSVCWKHHDYSVRVLENLVVDDSWFAFISSWDDGDDWRDPRAWRKANLNLGVSIPSEYIERECRRAQEIKSEQNTFKRLHGNVWTEQDERWLDMTKWDACGKDPETAGPLYMGLDMAARLDLSACVLVFGPNGDGEYSVKPMFWIPSETLAATGGARSTQDRVLLRQWADEGFIQVTDGNATDYDQVERWILDQTAEHDLRQLGHDRHDVTQLVTHLLDALGDERVVAVPPTIARMSAPAKELEKLVISKKLRHGGNPVLRWMASNVSIKHGQDGNYRPDRKKSRDKIDGIVALVIALECAIAGAKRGSIYDSAERSEGLLVLGAEGAG